MAMSLKGETMEFEELTAKFPNWTVRQGPDSDCRVCKGGGILRKTLSSGRNFEGPCMCTVLSEPHSVDKRNFLREVGRAAGRIRKRDFSEVNEEGN